MIGISVIVCSRKNKPPTIFLSNLENTIGYEYELIIIDNSQNRYSIFEAYNRGIAKSRGQYCCFVHDDVVFHTTGWGKILIEICEKDGGIGLIGVAGAKIKTRMPSAWWDCPMKYQVINILQHTQDHKIEKQVVGFKNNSIQEEVVAIDGVFMFMRKVKNITFSKKLKGFHHYDLDISLEFKKKGYKIIVTNQVLIEHFSQGYIDNSWYRSAVKIHNLHKDILPSRTCYIEEAGEERNNGSYFMKKAIRTGNKEVALRVWLQLFLGNPFSKNHLYFLKNFFK